MNPLRSLWLGTVPYDRAWELQRHLAAKRRDDAVDDCVLLLEHPPVFTMGRNGDAAHVPGGPDRLRALGAEYVEVDRGGSVTFHGPGQLVAYPIVRLAGIFPIPAAPHHGDVARYLRALEAALCRAGASAGVAAGVRPPYTGAWVGEAKVAAIGVKLSGGVTQHGVALNVSDEPLRWFGEIVPCGIEDGAVTSLHREGADRSVSPAQLGDELAAALATAFGLEAQPADERLRALVGEVLGSAPTALVQTH